MEFWSAFLFVSLKFQLESKSLALLFCVSLSLSIFFTQFCVLYCIFVNIPHKFDLMCFNVRSLALFYYLTFKIQLFNLRFVVFSLNFFLFSGAHWMLLNSICICSLYTQEWILTRLASIHRYTYSIALNTCTSVELCFSFKSIKLWRRCHLTEWISICISFRRVDRRRYYRHSFHAF